MGDRVQIPAYTDMWMRGARYGQVTKVTKNRGGRKVAHVLLDATRKIYRCLLDDCTPV